MKLSRFCTALLAVVLMLASNVCFAGVNVVSSGTCGNGRTWWMNVELDDNGVPGCITGMGCNGVVYRQNCGPGSLPNNPTTDVTVTSSGSSASVTVSSDSHIKVYDVFTGDLVYTHSGVVPSGISTNLNTASWSAGLFIIVAFDPATDVVTGAATIAL